MSEPNYKVKKCDNCGATFEVITACGWAYKTKTRYFCRYNCLREYQRKLSEQRLDQLARASLAKKIKAESRLCEEIVKEVKDDGCKGVS